MKNKLLKLFSAVGLAFGSMRSSRSLQAPPVIDIGKPDELACALATSHGQPIRFVSRPPTKGKRHRSQRERSNRRKASR